MLFKFSGLASQFINISNKQISKQFTPSAPQKPFTQKPSGMTASFTHHCQQSKQRNKTDITQEMKYTTVYSQLQVTSHSKNHLKTNNHSTKFICQLLVD